MTATQLDPAVAEASRKVAEEMTRFRAALPRLLLDPAVAGRWVVFKDGAVARAFDDESEGYRWAVTTLGRLAGFALVKVEPERVLHLGGAGVRWQRRREG
ncbi:MAG: hypothetical protein IT382_17805 [Deltaproteobacteria bacterium]|nr:hypothetical protein [Deltaproteobacteria bacterium]